VLALPSLTLIVMLRVSTGRRCGTVQLTRGRVERRPAGLVLNREGQHVSVASAAVGWKLLYLARFDAGAGAARQRRRAITIGAAGVVVADTMVE